MKTVDLPTKHTGEFYVGSGLAPQAMMKKQVRQPGRFARGGTEPLLVVPPQPLACARHSDSFDHLQAELIAWLNC